MQAIPGVMRANEIREENKRFWQKFKHPKHSVTITSDTVGTKLGDDAGRLFQRNLKQLLALALHYAKTTTRYKDRTGKLRRGTRGRAWEKTGRISLWSTVPYWQFVEEGTTHATPRQMFRDAITRAIATMRKQIQAKRGI